jgi:hypothetical protein
MKYNGKDYTILTAGSSDTIPDGFTKTSTVKYQGVNIPVLQKTLGGAADASVMNIVLLTADGKTSFFVYDPVTESCYPYQTISSTVSSYQILEKSAAASIPAGYESFDYTYSGGIVSAYRLISDPSNPQIMLYLMDASGISAFYYYDTQNQMLMLYRGSVVITAATTTPASTPTQAATVSPVPADSANITTPTVSSRLTIHSLSDYTNPIVLVIYLLVILCLILLVVCISLIVNRSRPYDSEDFEDYEDEYVEDNSFEDEYSDPNATLQHANDSVSDSPFVAKQPASFFSEFSQPVAEGKLFFGDNPQGEETKHNIPSIQQKTQGKIVQDTKDEHVPVRLRQELEAELTQKSLDAPPENIPDIRRPTAVSSKDVPVNMKRMPASTQPQHKLSPNDPDFDPDDE